jgi:hypothetical protein
MKPNTLFQVRFRPSVTPPRGWTHSAHYNVLNYDRHHNKYLIGKTWLPAKDFIKIEVQDAPVFDKPVLRKITSLSSNECIEILNSETCKSLLKQIENEGVLKIGIFEKSSIDIFPIYLYKSGKSIQLVHIRDIGCNLLPASKFVEVPQEKKPETDWSKVPFPEGYVIPKGTTVKLIHNGYLMILGSIGITQTTDEVPYIDWKNGEYRSKDVSALHINGGMPVISYNLSPVNPTDHPNHPEFGKKQEEPITELQKDECKTADERIKELEAICELRLQDNDGLADECEKWKTMLTATNQHIDKLRDICQIASTTGSKEIMQSVLKSIATGEI